MKSFHKYKFILFACIIVFLFQTGCTSDSPINTTPPDTMQDTRNTEMNLTQIEAGDYSSLLGTWKEVAYADNRFDATGQQWHPGRSATDSATLSVSADEISFNGSALTMQGNTFTDSIDTYSISFANNGTSLDAYTNQNAASFWAVTFYPKGAENNLEPNNGVQIDNSKNLIVVYFSGMRVETVFAQE